MIFTLTDRQFNVLDAYETEDYLIGKYVGSIIQTLDIDVLVKSENSDKWAHGNYIMCADKTGYKYWFTIYEAEDAYQSDIKSLICYSGTIDIVAEDANPIERPTSAQPFTYYFNKIFRDTGVRIGTNEIEEKLRTLEFTSENASNAEMLQYVLNGFDNAEADLIVEFDGSIPVGLVLNIYNRIGEVDPQTLLSDEDSSLVSLERTGSITHLATAIVPTGYEDEDGKPTTLLGKEYSEVDDKGNVLYYSPADHNRIYSVVGRSEFMVRLPNKDTGEFDGYINRSYQSEAATSDALWEAALKKLKELDKPQVTYEAKGHINCNVGDNIQIISHEMKPPVRLSARVLEYKFNDDDPSRNEYTFGNYRVLESKLDELTKFKKEVGLAISRTYRYINSVEESVKESINHVLTTADGKNSVSYGPDQPIDSQDGDLWYKSVGDGETEMYQLVGGVWQIILKTTDINANKELVDTAVATAEQAKQVAESAYLDSVAEAERLVTAQTEAFDAEMALRQGEIQDAKNQADLAVGKANSNAEAIFGKLDLATYEANKTAVETELGNKLATATYTAQKQTQDALIAGKVALTTYNTKMTSLDTAISGTSLRVDELEDGFALTATKTEVDSLKTRMNTAELSITATSNQLALTASQTDLNAATGRLTTAEGRITANATAIELRATKTDVNALTGRVTTAEGTITAQAGQIALRATTSTVNALTSRVSAAEASLVVQSGKIDLAATKTEAQDYAILATKNSGRWTGDYRVNTATPMELVEVDGTPLSDEYSYMASGVITGTGSVTGAVVLFVTNKVGSNGSGWTMHVLSEKAAKNSNQIEFFIASNGRPSVRLYGHTTFYVVSVTHTKTYGNIDVAKLLEDSISTVQSNLTVEAGKITALTTRVSGAESNITSVTQSVSGINTTISTLRTDVNGKATIVSLNQVKSTADGNKTTISNHAGRLTTVETTVSGLQTTVASKASQTQVTQLDTSLTSVVTNLNNLPVSGRNYFTKNTPVDIKVAGGGYVLRGSDTPNGFRITGVQAGNTSIRIPNVITSNGWWTVSFDIKGNQSVSVGVNVDICDIAGARVVTNSSNTYERRSVSVNVTNYTAAVYNFVDFDNFQWALFWIDNIKVEKGNKATDWSPAPEDVATQSQITQLSTDINLRVTKGSLMSEINVQAGRTIISTGKLYLDTGSTIMTTAYVNDLNAKTLTAITANITSIRSQVLVTDSISSAHIQGGTAMVGKLFSSTASINELTSKTAFITNIKAIDIAADRITTGTLNATNVNIINLNVSKIVGLNSTFVQSAWNGINTRISINSTALTASDSAGNQAIINTSGEIRSTSGGTDQTRGIFHRGRIWFYAASGSAVLNIGSHPVVGEGVNRGTLATARAEKLVIGRYNDYLTTNINAQVNPYITLEYGGTIGDESKGFTKIWKNLSMSGGQINDVQYISGYELNIHSTVGRLYLGVPTHNTLQIASANTRSYGNMEMMPGYSVTGTSDERLKNSITPTSISGLEVVNALEYYDYYWNDRPEIGKQFGLIAQRSPFVSERNKDSGYWGINMNKLSLATAKAVKEVDTKVSRIDTYVTQHELEIKNLKLRIQQLEEDKY